MRKGFTRLACLVFASLSVTTAPQVQKLEVVVQSGHLGFVEKMAFTSDGGMLASADADGTIKLWDLATYKEVRTINTGLNETAASPNELAFSSDDKSLFVLATDRSAYAFDVGSGNKISQLPKSGRELNLFGAAINTRRMLGAQINEDGGIQVVDLKTGKESFRFSLPSANDLDFPTFQKIIFSSDGSLLVGAVSGGRIVLIDTASGKVVRVFNTGDAMSLAFSLDGKTLLAAEKDENSAATFIRARLVASGVVTKTTSITAGEIVSLALNPDATTLAGIVKTKNAKTAEDEYSVKLWNSTTSKQIRELTIDYVSSSWELSQVRFSPDGRTLAIAAGDIGEGRIYLRDVETGREIAQLKRQTSLVDSVRYLKDGQLIVESEGMRVWDLQRGRQVRTQVLAEHAISSDGKRLAAYNVLSHTFEVTEIDSGNLIAKLNWQKFNVTSNTVMFSPDDRLLLVYPIPIFNPRPEDRLMLFDAATGELLFTFPDNSKVVTFAPGGKLLAYGAVIDEKKQKFAVRIWNVEERKQLQTIATENSVSALAFNPAGDRLAVAGYVSDGVLNKYFLDLYVVPSGELLRGLGEQGIVDALAFSQDGLVLASESSQQVRLWNNKGDEIGTLAGHGAFVRSLAFSPDGRTLASGGGDGQVIFWDYKKREITLRLIVDGESDYVFITPDNYYLASSKGAAAAVAFRQGSRAFPFEQFDVRFNRPHLILKALGSVDDKLIEAYARAFQKRLRQYGLTESDLQGELNLPEVSLALGSIPSVTKQRNLHFRVLAKDRGFALTSLHVFVNDVPIYGARGQNVGERKAKSLTSEVSLELSPGNNRVQVSVVNAKGIESGRQTFGVIYDGESPPPELYVLAIGVAIYTDGSQNLTYPAEDAASVVKLFEDRAKQKEKVLVIDPKGSHETEQPKSFYKVHALSLTDQNVTVEKIGNARKFLEQAGTDDEIVVFISGHGVLDNSYNYFFATHDIDFDHPAARGLGYEALENLLDNLRARRKLVLIDTCHAGEVEKAEAETLKINEAASDKGGVIKSLDVKPKSGSIEVVANSFQNSLDLVGELFADLRLGSGASVVSASGGLEYAYESPRWSGGVFTYALRLGLAEMQADANNDGKVSSSELRDFVRAKVLELTKGKQRPTFRRESVAFDYRIF